MFSQTIFIITIKGTARIIPKIPQSQPARESETRITNGEMPRLSPSIFGSITFPRIIFTAITQIPIIIGAIGDG